METLLNILDKKQKKYFLFLTLLMILNAVFEIITLNYIYEMMNYFSNSEFNSNNILFKYIKESENILHYSPFIFFVFFLLFSFKTIIYIVFKWCESKYLASLRAELSTFFFKGYQNLPRIFHLRSNISETTKNITVETDYVVSAMYALSNIVMEFCILSSIIIFLMIINYKVAIITFSLLILFSLIIYYFNSKVITKLGKKRPILIQLRLKTIIEGLSINKIFGLGKTHIKVLNDFKEHNNGIAKIFRSISFRNALPRPFFEVFVLLLVFFFITLFLSKNRNLIEIIPILGTFLAAGYRLIPCFSRIMQSIQSYQFYGQASKKLSLDKDRFLIFTKNDIKNESVKINNSKIEIKNLSFSFEKNINKNVIFDNLSLSINPGEKIGFIGESGSGKSTLLDLIMGLLNPSKGEIFIDSKPISSIKKLWQEKIGCVAQDVFITDDSLKSNIAFGLEDNQINEKKIQEVLQITKLEEFVENLNFGTNTLLGEQGARVSGGQKQRIGLARALYLDPEILILDEATNALDSLNEKKIISNIFENFSKSTIIFVSHNLDNLQLCNKVFKIENKNLRKVN